MGFKPGDRVVCCNVGWAAPSQLAFGRVEIVESVNVEDATIKIRGTSWAAGRFRLADPPKPARMVTIRAAFAIESQELYIIEDVRNYDSDSEALDDVQSRCDEHVHSGFFNLVVEIPEPVELTATVEDAK